MYGKRTYIKEKSRNKELNSYVLNFKDRRGSGTVDEERGPEDPRALSAETLRQRGALVAALLLGDGRDAATAVSRCSAA